MRYLFRIAVQQQFLAARLGDLKAEGPIISYLEEKHERNEEEILLRALAELSPSHEFAVVAGRVGIDPKLKRYTNSLFLSGFRHAVGPEKTELAEQLLMSEYLWDRREAVQYLLTHEEVDIMQKYILVDPRMEMPFMLEAVHTHIGQLMVLEAAKNGYRIENTDTGIRIIKE